jgi:hypothetical protein
MTNETLTQRLKDEGIELDDSLSFQMEGANVLFVANKPAKADLLLAPESQYTHQADAIGVSKEAKIGESDFDARFVIRDPDGAAGTVLTPEVIAAVEALEPFIELQMSKKRYRLLKEGLNEAQALDALRGLEKLVALTSD